MRARLLLVTFLLLGAMALAGCVEQIPVFPVGAYVAAEKDQTIVLDFQLPGEYTAIRAGSGLLLEGSYRPAADTITFYADPPCASEATYRWVLEEDTLSFAPTGEDRCRERRECLRQKRYHCVTSS